MPRSCAFTLLDCLLALAILAVLLGVSLPGLSDTLEQRKGRLAMQKITSSIALARSASIKSNETVTLCPSSDKQVCGGAWQFGHIVFSDPNGNRTLDQGDFLMASVEHLQLTGTIRFRSFQNRQYLQFTAQGFAHFQNGNFTYCSFDRNPTRTAQLVLNAVGRARQAIDFDGDGIVDDGAGNPVLCDD